MLALNWFKVFIWKTIFTKAKQVYLAVIRLEIAFEASIWHQWEKEKELSDKECKIKTLQNQTFYHVIKIFKRISIETLKVKTFTSSLHVHLNMLQDKIMLCNQVNDHTQKIKQACKLICIHLMNVNCIISHLFIIKKVILLNNLIQEDAKIQSRCK